MNTKIIKPFYYFANIELFETNVKNWSLPPSDALSWVTAQFGSDNEIKFNCKIISILSVQKNEFQNSNHCGIALLSITPLKKSKDTIFDSSIVMQATEADICSIKDGVAYYCHVTLDVSQNNVLMLKQNIRIELLPLISLANVPETDGDNETVTKTDSTDIMAINQHHEVESLIHRMKVKL